MRIEGIGWVCGDKRAIRNLEQGGDVSNFKATKIVHISDTHSRHSEFLPIIPNGDILVHSGDIMKRQKEELHEEILSDFNRFLGTLPHKHKIFVGGNNEYCLRLPKNNPNVQLEEGYSNVIVEEEYKHYPKAYIKNKLTSCIYLQDEGITIEGIRFYGSPWTSSSNMAFSANRTTRKKIWKSIPKNKVDVLITHMPPFGILDCAYSKREKEEQLDDAKVCRICKKRHDRYTHWGCEYLLKRVQRVRPKLHLFGHVHDDVGFHLEGDTLFVNSAMDLYAEPHVITYYVHNDDVTENNDNL
jgi:Icc-related predicted phosphoesterase